MSLNAASGKLQLLGRTLVLQLHRVIRTMRIHDPTNQALLIATENLKDTINTLWAALDGDVRLQFVQGVVYLNDVRVRLAAAANEQVNLLEKEFEERGLGGIAFSRPVDSTSLREFLLAFSATVETEEDLAAFRRSLEQFRELALELLDPKQFSDGFDEEQALRIDKKTFALQTYAKTVVALREYIDAVREGGDLEKSKLSVTRVVQDLIDIATERVNFALKLAAIKSADQYDFNHGANTCVLSIVIGRALGVERLELVDLGTSALLADIGFALMPNETLETTKELGKEERASLHEEMLRHLRLVIGGGQISDSLVRRVIVAYEHHQSYLDPETQAPRQMHLFSRIVAVADAFDALTTRRPWREGHTADEALRVLVEAAGTQYDPVVVKVLVNLMGLYPLGSVVRLENGELAIVYHNSNDPEHFVRPWVKIVKDEAGALVKKTVIRDLSQTAGPSGRIAGFAHASALEGLDPGMAICI